MKILMSNEFEIVAEGYAAAGEFPLSEAVEGVPPYHELGVAVGRRRGEYKAIALEVWGHRKGYDEESGRRKVTVREAEAGEALRGVLSRAVMTGLDNNLLLAASEECARSLQKARREGRAG